MTIIGTLITLRYPLSEAEIDAVIKDRERTYRKTRDSLDQVEGEWADRIRAHMDSPRAKKRWEVEMEGLRRIYRVSPEDRLRNELDFWQRTEERLTEDREEPNDYPLLPWIYSAQRALRRDDFRKAVLVLREALASGVQVPEGLDVLHGEIWEDVDVPPVVHGVSSLGR